MSAEEPDPPGRKAVAVGSRRNENRSSFRRGPAATALPRLLVSVSSPAEAESALAGGAALIDVKEPSRGPLGRADRGVIEAVLERVGGRVPMSAALGELVDTPICSLVNGAGDGLTFVKWGLAGCGQRPRWRQELIALRALIEGGPGGGSGCGVVAVAYADWNRANAPPPAEVAALAAEQHFAALLIDTWLKDGSTLLDWLPLPELAAIREGMRAAGVPVALAGSLGLEQIRALRGLGPNWFAVRGAVCRDGQRGGVVEAERVRALVAELAESEAPA